MIQLYLALLLLYVHVCDILLVFYVAQIPPHAPSAYKRSHDCLYSSIYTHCCTDHSNRRESNNNRLKTSTNLVATSLDLQANAKHKQYTISTATRLIASFITTACCLHSSTPIPRVWYSSTETPASFCCIAAVLRLQWLSIRATAVCTCLCGGERRQLFRSRGGSIINERTK